MECTSKKFKTKLGRRLEIIHGSVNVSSESSLSSGSESGFHPFHTLSRKRKKAPCDSKRDYLTRLFERKKLKEKSLSKKLRTPLHRKINRTCWPIELKKVSKIKKKPHEKRREKPTYRSLTRRKYSDPPFMSIYNESNPQFSCSELEFLNDHSLCFRDTFSKCRARSPQITSSELEFLDDDSFAVVYQSLNKKNYQFEKITPGLLIKVLQDPEYSETGATIDMIIRKIRTPDFDSALPQLKEDISMKLTCAVKLGIIVENDGYYRIGDYFKNVKSSKDHINAIWNWWYRRMKKTRR